MYLGLFAGLLTLFLESSMWLFYVATDLFGRFLASRNYKIQMVVHVERKSVVLLSGCLEASRRRFFILIIVRVHEPTFYWLSTSLKNCHPEASRHLGGRRIEFSSTRATRLMK